MRDGWGCWLEMWRSTTIMATPSSPGLELGRFSLYPDKFDLHQVSLLLSIFNIA